MHGNRRLGIVGLALGLTLVGCGADDGSEAPSALDPASSAASAPASPQATPAPSDEASVPADAPACADVWREGAKIPRTYAGCVASGAYVERDVTSCSSGQRLIRFDDAFYGVLGGVVVAAETTPLTEDRAYLRILRGCRA